MDDETNVWAETGSLQGAFQWQLRKVFGGKGGL